MTGPSGAWRCACCAKELGELPDVAVPLPMTVADMAPGERAARCVVGEETAIVEGRHFYVRANVEIPVRGRDRPWGLTLWCTLAEPNFRALVERWDDPARTELGPFFSWVDNAAGCFPPCGSLPGELTVRGTGLRPVVHVLASDHPLARAQHEGLELHEAVEFARSVLGPAPPSAGRRVPWVLAAAVLGAAALAAWWTFR